MFGVHISLKKGQHLEIWEINCFHVPNHQDLKRERLRGKRGRGERKPQRERQRFRSVGWHRGRIRESRNGWVGRDFRVIPSHPESWTGTPSLSRCSNPKHSRSLCSWGCSVTHSPAEFHSWEINEKRVVSDLQVISGTGRGPDSIGWFQN